MNERSSVLVEPLLGAGAIWIALCLLLTGVAVVIGDYIGIVGKLALAGAWAGYFGAAFRAGSSDPAERLAGPGLELQDALIRSLAFAALAAAVVAAPLWLLSSRASDLRRAERAAVEGALAADELAPPPPPEYDEDGRRIDRGERPEDREARREGLRGRLSALDEERAVDVLLRHPLRGWKVAAAAVLALLEMLYLPAALAVGTATRPADVFLPSAVVAFAVRGGASYLSVTAAAAAVSIGPPLVLALLGASPRALPEVLLGGPWLAAYRFGASGVRDGLLLALVWAVATTYAAGVAGVGLGRLAGARPSIMPALDDD